MTRPPPPPEESWRSPLRASRGDDAEVSWLGVKARGRLPNPWGSVASAAVSPLTVAGAAPVLHRTSLSRREATLARPPSYRQRAPRKLRRQHQASSWRHAIRHALNIRAFTATYHNESVIYLLKLKLYARGISARLCSRTSWLLARDPLKAASKGKRNTDSPPNDLTIGQRLLDGRCPEGDSTCRFPPFRSREPRRPATTSMAGAKTR